MAEKITLPTYETLLAEAIRSLAIDGGMVTSPVMVGGNTLSDDTKNWATDVHKNRIVKIIRGTGAGQVAVIEHNTAKALVIKQAWALPLDSTSVYQILGTDIAAILDPLTKLIPIAKAAIFNAALPAAEANWLGAGIVPTNSPSFIRIYTCVSVAGILRVARTISGVTLTENLNGGNALAADASYMFTVPWRTGDSINIRYSVTTGTINRLLIDEIGGAE